MCNHWPFTSEQASVIASTRIVVVLELTRFRGHRLCGLCDRGGVLVFEGYRTDLAEGSVASAVVVDGVDPSADGMDRLGVGDEVVSVVELGLQCGPEAFLLGIVPARPGPPCGQAHLEICCDTGDLLGSVLTAAVGVKPVSA